MEILKIVITKEWFDAIAVRKKKIEYRDVGQFWNSRLYDIKGKMRKYIPMEALLLILLLTKLQ